MAGNKNEHCFRIYEAKLIWLKYVAGDQRKEITSPRIYYKLRLCVHEERGLADNVCLEYLENVTNVQFYIPPPKIESRSG